LSAATLSSLDGGTSDLVFVPVRNLLLLVAEAARSLILIDLAAAGNSFVEFDLEGVRATNK
jgi:hypothetical protein